MSTDDLSGWFFPKFKMYRIMVKLDDRNGSYKEYAVHAKDEKEAKQIVRKELRKEITRRLNAMKIEEVSEPEHPVSGAV